MTSLKFLVVFSLFFLQTSSVSASIGGLTDSGTENVSETVPETVPEENISEEDPREQALLSRFNGVIDGTWTGSFEITSPTPDPVTHTLSLCLMIDSTEVNVSTKENGKWQLMKPGQFEVIRYGPSAIVYAIGGGETPGGGPWVESWVVSLTQATADKLLVRTSRVVNNVDVLYGEPDGRFSFSGEGILKSSLSCETDDIEKL